MQVVQLVRLSPVFPFPLTRTLILNLALGYCAARVRAIFQLPRFCHEFTTQPLAYVELFTPFTASAQAHQHELFQTKHATHQGRRITKVVPLSALRMACHLSPQYAMLDPSLSITSADDLLSSSNRFFLSRHSSYFFFSLMDYWKNPARHLVSTLMCFQYSSPLTSSHS
jgi:hypothetical protein